MPTTRPFGRSVDPDWLMAFSLMVSLGPRSSVWQRILRDNYNYAHTILKRCRIQKKPGPWSWKQKITLNFCCSIGFPIVFPFQPQLPLLRSHLQSKKTKSPWLKAALRSSQSHHPPRRGASVCRRAPRSRRRPPRSTFRWPPRHHLRPWGLKVVQGYPGPSPMGTMIGIFTNLRCNGWFMW